MKQRIEMIKRWFYSRKLKAKIRFLFLILVLTYITTLFFVYYFFVKQNMVNYVLKSNYNNMVSITNNLNVELEAVDTMSQLIATNSDVIEFLRSPEDVNSRVSHKALLTMYDISNRYNYVSSVYVFKNDNENISLLKQITYVDMNLINDPGWNKEIREKAGSYVIRINGNGAFVRKTGEPVISVIREINDVDTQKPIGLIIINLSTDILVNSFKDMTSSDRHFCYYSDKQDILRQDKEIKEFKKLNINNKEFEQIVKQNLGVTKILSYTHIPDTPFILAEYDSVSFFGYISVQAIFIIIIIIVLSVICLGIIGIFISVFIEKPIERLVQYLDIEKVGWSKKEEKSQYSLKNKVLELKKNNSNLIEVNKIIDELLDKEKAMRKAELEVLQEQINPHFLYNTLGTIADFALRISADEIYDAVETLGSFYRRFLSKGSREITIREEIAIVKDYLKLQKLRYQGVFEDEYEINEDLLDYKIPKLILQPLVENSLYHGVRLKGEKGVIKISVYKKDEKVHIVVYDNGVGMSEEQIMSLMSEENKKSFGFKGTIERIRYYYGEDDVFEIESEEGVYCKVDIKIPLVKGW